MKKICSMVLCCALLLGVLVVPGAAAATNTLQQGFENEYIAWATLNGKSECYAVSDEVFHEGSKALKYTHTGKGYNLVNLTYNDDLKLTPGKTYAVSFWLYAPQPETVQAETTALRLYTNTAYFNPWTGSNGSGSTGWNAGQQVAVINQNYTFNTWQQYTCTVNGTAKDNALHLYVFNGQHDFYIDDITATEVAPVTVDFKEADGTVIDQRMGLPGSTLTYPRTPEKEGYTFDGWYEDADFNTPFTATAFPSAGKTLYAKFIDAAIRDTYEDESADYPVNDNAKLTLGAKDGILTLTASNEYSGNVWISLTPTTTDYELTKDKTYRVEFDIKSDGGKALEGVLGAWNNVWVTSAPADNKISWHTNGIPADWQHFSAEFLATSGTLRTCFYGLTNNQTIQFKNLKITEITPQTALEKAVANELTYNGSSLRPEDAEVKENPVAGNNGKAAIRFKSTVSNNLIQNGITVNNVHYSVVEYGHTYFREDLMGTDKVLNADTAYTTGKNAKNAVAYRKDGDTVTTNIWFSKDDTAVTYTVALYGFTDDTYALTYVARPYVKLVADGSTDEQIVYGGSTQFAAFSDVADRAFYAHPGDVYGRKAAYTDVNGDSWSETYEIRKALYDTVLSKLSGYSYLAPAAAAE